MSQDPKTATRTAPRKPSNRKSTPNSRNAVTRPSTKPGNAGGAATVRNPPIAKQRTATKPPTNSGSLGESSRTSVRRATSEKTVSPQPHSRAQATLPAVAVALVVLTVVTALGLFVADSAIAGADRTPEERRVAAATAARLVAADGPVSARANVLNESAVATFDAAALRNLTVSEYATAVRLNSTTVAATADATGGTTVSTVRANDRVVLHNGSGLEGTFTVDVSPYETTEIRLQAAGTLPDGAVTVEYDAPTTSKATLAVTVDA